MTNFIDKYENWLLQKGIMSKKSKLPQSPMSKSGVRSRVAQIRNILVNMGYMKKTKKKKSNGTNYTYLVYSTKYPEIKAIKNISLPDFERYLESEFPDLATNEERGRKGGYVFAIWKFSEFLTHELHYWSIPKLERLKRQISPPTYKGKDIDTIEPDKIDKLIKWLETAKSRQGTHYKYHAMLYLSRWLGGMRHGAVIRITQDYQGAGQDKGCLRWDGKKNTCTIWGKGAGGWNKPRNCTILPEVKLKLREIQQWSINEFGKQKWLFTNCNGDQHADETSYLNRAFKRLAKQSGLFEDHEIKLMQFHAMGRHTFGTYFYGKIPDKLLKEEMGHEEIDTTLKYAQIQHIKDRQELFINAMNGNNEQEDPHPFISSADQKQDHSEEIDTETLDNAIELIKSLENGTKAKYLKSLDESLRLKILSKLLGA